MPLNVMLNPKKQGCYAYFEPNSGLHLTVRKMHGSIKELNPFIFNALKNGTIVPLNFRVNLETMEVEMIGNTAAGNRPASNMPPDNKPYANTDTLVEPKMQVSRPAPGQKQTVIEKPPENPAAPAAPTRRPQSDAGQPEPRKAKSRPVKASKEE